MNARSILIAAVAVFAAGSAVASEPVRAPQPRSEAPRDAAAPVLMASADVDRAAEVVAAGAAQGNQAPAKRPRTARVTTCRCADTPTNPNP